MTKPTTAQRELAKNIIALAKPMVENALNTVQAALTAQLIELNNTLAKTTDDATRTDLSSLAEEIYQARTEFPLTQLAWETGLNISSFESQLPLPTEPDLSARLQAIFKTLVQDYVSEAQTQSPEIIQQLNTLAEQYSASSTTVAANPHSTFCARKTPVAPTPWTLDDQESNELYNTSRNTSRNTTPTPLPNRERTVSDAVTEVDDYRP
ncbi:MAG: hypothetical protein A3J38_09275 [Gammaproteobacteria bacterium RIFCSPHIGHO2_12_FULL_45_9]|nr:MAG: hypothetical protein A3J38_09275 [Gammaproteobacteria bacterium RIFCSPHIGHO2_12_FULL_45_9]